MVARVVALWQGLVRVEGHKWPINRKPLVGTRAEEGEDNREGSAPSHDPSTPPSTAPVRARKNIVAPIDVGHGVQGRVGDPPSMGD
jgi:hypothetical protein